MKALTCPQCGAALKNVSLEKHIVQCAYCRAHVLIRPFGENNEEVEVSLVTRAESGIEEKEIYERGKLTFKKEKYQPNEFLRRTYAAQQKGENPRNFGFLFLILGIVGFVLVAVLLSWTL
jgi:DNA-directed RNA polymerase subunit RPC12/RpoP